MLTSTLTLEKHNNLWPLIVQLENSELIMNYKAKKKNWKKICLM